ncbi:ABC transporter permease [Streptomyces sp. NPDC048172]|uniref:ABC transporter permease n=1 Tax=Streptomyces sp. NPDC048172 TaxID=3365505 RepID=UPI0037118E99
MPNPRSFVPNGLARAAVRFKPASFAGTFVALLMASMIISACGFLAESGVRASVPPERYAEAPVVATADQKAHLITGKGEDRADEGVMLPGTARLDAGPAVRAARAVDGVARAVPDVTFALRHGDTTLTAHGWGSHAFTGARLTSGSAPRTADEAVVDAATAERLRARPGDRIALTTPHGDRKVRVSGIAAAKGSGSGAGQGPAVWFTDRRAMALAGHPGKADALAVLPERGASAGAVARALKDDKAFDKATASSGASVRTGDGRGEAEGSDVGYAKEALEGLGFSFGGIAALTAVFTASGTVALSVAQRRREFALLRAIGATPRQIRRSIATEALFVAPLAGLLGCLPGLALARWWFGELRSRGAVPEGVELHTSAIPVWSAAGTVVGTALLAGYMAARRPSKIKPGQALAESAVERFRPGVVRTLLGVAALVGGLLLARLAATEGGEDAANLALGVVMCLMLAVALLGQYLAKACSWLLGLPLRAGSASTELAAANSWAHARRLASAVTPVVLAMAFCSTLVFLQTSQDRETEVQQRAGMRADHIVSGGDTGLPTTAAARAAEAPGVSEAVGVLRTQVLVKVRSGGEPLLQSAETQGVGGTGRALARVQDLDVREGSLDGLRAGTVALDRLLAKGAGAHPGDRVRLTLPDGTETRPRLAAVYARGTGLPAVTLPRATLASHADSEYDSEVLVREAPGADGAEVARSLAPLGDVADRDSYAQALDRDRAVNAWGNMTMAAVLAGFAAVAAANTLVMTIAERRRELGTLRLIGSTRRQVLRMVHWEAVLVAISGIGLGTAISLATLVPMIDGLFDADPYVPPALYAAFAGSVLALALLSTTLPARNALRAVARTR